MTFIENFGALVDGIIDFSTGSQTVMVSVIRGDDSAIRGDGGIRTVSVTALDEGGRPIGHRYFTAHTGLLPFGVLTLIVLPGYWRRFDDIGVQVAAATYRKEEQ